MLIKALGVKTAVVRDRNGSIAMRDVTQQSLSRRQAEIANLIVAGKSSREIAGTLSVSPRTVEHHIEAIFNRLGVGSRVELVTALLKLGLPERARPAVPPSRSVDVTLNNLPRKLTSFIGREAEISEITALVGSHQLVTLVGSGGVGKTRTALAVAEGIFGAFADGVWFTELAPLSRGVYIAGTATQALGLTLAIDGDPVANLARALKSKQLLLVFDNCEHLVNDVAKVAAVILNDCHKVKILATSREPLRVRGEATYRMPSLPVPPAAGSVPLSVAEALRYVSVELFVERARAIDHRFALSDENAPIVADICRRLDGIALAIELAAARVNLLSPKQLCERLDERFRVLTGGGRDHLPRHQTLRALIDWSHDLLDEREQRLFRRLGIFANAFTLEAASAVGGDSDCEQFEVFDLLASLVDKSLVMADPNGDSVRYRLLESTRMYALEKLVAAGEREALASRHLGYVRDLFVELYGRNEQLGPGIGAAFATELDDLRASADGSTLVAALYHHAWALIGNRGFLAAQSALGEAEAIEGVSSPRRGLHLAECGPAHTVARLRKEWRFAQARRSEATAAMQLADIEFRRRQRQRAADLIRGAALLARSNAGTATYLRNFLASLASVLAVGPDVDSAIGPAIEALTLHHRYPENYAVTPTIELLACIAATLGDLDRPARLTGSTPPEPAAHRLHQST